MSPISNLIMASRFSLDLLLNKYYLIKHRFIYRARYERHLGVQEENQKQVYFRVKDSAKKNLVLCDATLKVVISLEQIKRS
jgi:hypothetical protein